MTYIEDLKDAGAVEITPREWFLRTVQINPEDNSLRCYAAATQAILSMSMIAHGKVRMLWLFSEDVDSSKISLGDVWKGIPEFPGTTIEMAEDEKSTDQLQMSPGELRLEKWDRGFPCLYIQPVADGGPPADYFVFFVEGVHI